MKNLINLKCSKSLLCVHPSESNPSVSQQPPFPDQESLSLSAFLSFHWAIVILHPLLLSLHFFHHCCCHLLSPLPPIDRKARTLSTRSQSIAAISRSLPSVGRCVAPSSILVPCCHSLSILNPHLCLFLAISSLAVRLSFSLYLCRFSLFLSLASLPPSLPPSLSASLSAVNHAFCWKKVF